MLDYKMSVKEQLGGRNKLDHVEDDEERVIYQLNLRRNLLINEETSTVNTDSIHNNIEETKITATDNKNPKNDKGLSKLNVTNANIKTSKAITKIFKFKGYNNKEIKDVNVKKIVNNIKSPEINIHSETVLKADKKFKEIQNNDMNIELNKVQNDIKKLDFNDLKILEDIKNVKGILRRSGIAENEINKNKIQINNNFNKEKDRCWFLEKFKQNLLLGKVVNRRCKANRRSNFDGKFITVMTNVLNKYVDTEFRFTDEMTEILLENIFGGNTDLRNNIFDVNKLLRYLRKSVDRHKTHSNRHVITLTSRHCLTVALPGCFCRSGFVENSGQCVKPEDCVSDISHLHYLSRIVIL